MICMPKQYTFLRSLSLCFVLLIATPLWSTEEIKIDSIDAQIITTIDPNTLSLEGNVVIKTELLEFWSKKAIYDKSKKSIKLEGSIRVLSKNLDISAQEMEANLLDSVIFSMQGLTEEEYLKQRNSKKFHVLKSNIL